MSAALVAALAMGFAGSGHCGAMCGGIAASAGSGVAGERRGLGAALNAGRLVTYGVAGALAGGLGGRLGDLSAVHEAVAPLRGIAGLLLVAIGAGLAAGGGVFARLDRLGGPLMSVVRRGAARMGRPSTPLRALALGALWGLLPCGLVYAALGLSATVGSAREGLVTMLGFGAGTAPALLIAGHAPALLRGILARRAVRITVGAAVALSGLINVATAWPDLHGTRLLASTTHACCRARAAQAHPVVLVEGAARR